MTQYDAIIIGGGVAGLSVAYQLAEHASVLLLEQESQLAYHSSGRSAALYAASYGSQYPAIHALSKASNQFFSQPLTSLCESPLLTSRGLLSIAHKDQAQQLQQKYQNMQQHLPASQLLVKDEILQLVPELHQDYCHSAIYDSDVFDVDVHALLEMFRKGCIHNSAQIKTGLAVKSIQRSAGSWLVESEAGRYSSTVVINAAGAWADQVAELAGISALGIQPLRRSVVLIDPPRGADISCWPMVVEFEERFYFKPDAGQLLVSPADETPSPPCDSRPEQLDVAMAAQHAENTLGFSVAKINHDWSGLRSFAKDRSPVVGFSQQKKGFFWLAALGGYGVQTAPAMGRYAAALILGKPIPQDIVTAGMRDEYVTPERFL